ncbi:MAG: DUF3631 domain-containing protein [bacterium]
MTPVSKPGRHVLPELDALKAGSPRNEIASALKNVAIQLTDSDRLEKALLREEAIQKLSEIGIKSAAKVVDAAFESDDITRLSDTDQGSAMSFCDHDPWPDEVSGKHLLTEIAQLIRRYVVLQQEAIDAISLWIVFAHAHEGAQISPILCLTSPTKRCGKTTLLHLVGSLVPRPLFAANITPAAIYRTIERHIPSLLVDEADTFVRGNEELRGILNSGHLRSAAIVVRTARGDFEPRTYRTWCPKVVALIGRLSDTIEDRAIMIPLKRCVSGEKPERLRFDSLDQLIPVQRRAFRWAKDHATELQYSDPIIPVELGDRAADNWRHILAIADLAGGEWPRRARVAAVTLSGSGGDREENVCELLLHDIKDLFEKRQADRMSSEEIVLALADMYDRPWPEFTHNKPMTKAKLARLLKPFGIQTMTFRTGPDLRKGYSAQSFHDAFSRYAPTLNVTP